MIIEARKNPNGMNAVQVIEVIKDLAKSQGFYSRMWQSIQENILTDEEEYENFQQFCEQQNFKDAVDLVLFLETENHKITVDIDRSDIIVYNYSVAK